ncbi:hypothetical protein AAG570_007942 [Ranatra chinensis]|uniref:CABIT domain-containing protein n=1 Tax=Ranatra chinensis TaxID=642074 RepID=A0ABD0XTB6_9HEMI
MATDGQVVTAAARWTDEALYLKDFAARQEFPAVVKIVKGQYGGLGVPSLPNPGLQSTALLVSAGRRNKIVAQAVKLKEGRRLVGAGPRIAIPDTYGGYFEILSEEGRAARCIESVAELARRKPESGCLVREPVRAVTREGTGQEAARTIAAGETLLPEVEVRLPGHKCSFLRCTDSSGRSLLLPMDQRAKFSPLAKEENISGVHTARNLLNKRMPITVRLVHGPPPAGLKSSAHFAPEMRLLAAFREEHVFALPLQKDTGNVVALPLAAPVKLQTARNADKLKSLEEFRRLAEKCCRLVTEAVDRAYVLEGKTGERIDGGYRPARVPPPDRYPNENRAPSQREYDEIDQIYDYVRGFAPLPESVRSPFADSASPTPERRSRSPPRAPEPPPVDTIPGKKIPFSKPEKRTRKESLPQATPRRGGAIYLKNANTHRGRILRQKSSSPPSSAEKGSPVFGIRYKSLSDLHQTMDLDGTLDSSRSGGRTSGDSGGAKLPEKRSRRIARPLSLTDLVSQLRRQPDKPKLPFPSTRTQRIATLYL